MSRFDRWSRDNMPEGDALRRIEDGIRRTMAGAIQDAYNGISRSASMIPDPPRGASVPPRAVNAEVPITSPPGLRYIDQMCDAQDQKDRLIAIQQAADLREIERRLDRRGPRVRMHYDPLKAYDDSVPGLHRDKEDD